MALYIKDKIKEPNGKVWWLGAIVICLLLWGGGYMLTKYISLNYFPVGKDNCAQPCLVIVLVRSMP